MELASWHRSVHRASRALAFASSLLVCLCACQPSPESEAQDSSAKFFLATDQRFKADHEAALRAQFRSNLSKAGRTNALEGVLRLMIGHELGHAFEHVHGPLEGIDSEDFADLFSLNLVADLWAAHPTAHIPTEEYATIMNAFLANVPSDAHLGRGGIEEMERRRALYSCAHYGIVADFARSDPIAYYAEGRQIPLENIGLIADKAIIESEPRPDWLLHQTAKRQLAMVYLDLRKAVIPSPALERCVAVERRFRQYLVSKLAAPQRTRDIIAERDRIPFDKMQINFEYELPETEGAQLVFALATPSLPGTAPGVSYLPWLLMSLGWFPEASGGGVVRLQYCGVGNANAYFDKDRMVLTLCYEIGENINAHPELYPPPNPDLYKPMNRYAEKNFPEIMRKTNRMLSSAK